MTLTTLKQTLALRAFGLLKIPLINYVRPSVIRLDDEESTIKIPLGYRTRNHVKSMYFGVLAVGVDCAAGLLAFHLIQKSKKKISLIFKDFHADFHKRATSDIHFICKEGKKIQKQIERTLKTGERTNETLQIIAIDPKSSSTDPVATFALTLSLKSM